MSRPILGYWDIRCLAEPIRLMFEYLEIDFEDKKYITGDFPKYERKEWLNDKAELGFDFPNVPYLIDNDVKLTESWAIMRYIARKNGGTLTPQSNQEKIDCDILQGFIEDFRYRFINLGYYSDAGSFEENKKTFYKRFMQDLDRAGAFLGSRLWLSGEAITFVDFAFCEVLDQIRLMFPDFVNSCHTNVARYLEAFDKLPQIVAYRNSDRYKELPINSKYAFWGGNSIK